MGRPRKDQSEKKTQVSISLTPAEIENLDKIISVFSMAGNLKISRSNGLALLISQFATPQGVALIRGIFSAVSGQLDMFEAAANETDLNEREKEILEIKD